VDWSLEHLRGSAEDLHHRVLPARRGIWVCTPDRPALVLGSSQDEATVDVEFCRRSGIDVARRRSGGGGVYVHPTESLWVDVVIPRNDELWHDDIGRSMWWLGETWRDGVQSSVVGGLVVHHGALVANEWSRTLCFAGVGPGEVMAGSAKVVGISQRRTREMARFQCIVYRRWDAELHTQMIPALAGDAEHVRSLVVPIEGLEGLTLLGCALG
jgi:lipoate-protein ligase A